MANKDEISPQIQEKRNLLQRAVDAMNAALTKHGYYSKEFEEATKEYNKIQGKS